MKEMVMDTEIIDLSGKLVASSNERSFEKGDHIINLDLSDLEQGIYFVRIKASTLIFSRKIIVVK